MSHHSLHARIRRRTPLQAHGSPPPFPACTDSTERRGASDAGLATIPCMHGFDPASSASCVCVIHHSLHARIRRDGRRLLRRSFPPFPACTDSTLRNHSLFARTRGLMSRVNFRRGPPLSSKPCTQRFLSHPALLLTSPVQRLPRDGCPRSRPAVFYAGL